MRFLLKSFFKYGRSRDLTFRVPPPRLGNGPGADRTAAFFRPCAGIHHGFPGVALRALPPDLPAAAGGDHLRRQGRVLGGMPVSGGLRFQGGQVVEPRQNLPPRTIGAVRAVYRPRPHRRLIRMPQGTAPPHPAVAAGGAGLGGQGGVPGVVPLSGHSGVGAGQVVLAGHHHFSGAHRTARAPGAGGDHGLPAVAFFTAPPDFLVGACKQVHRAQGPVAFGVPLPEQVRVGARQVVFTGAEDPIGAVRTARTADPALHSRLPLVALFTAPPDLLMTAEGQAFRGLSSVSFYVPLLQQC